MDKPAIDLISQEAVDLKEKILVVDAAAVPAEEGVFARSEDEIVELIQKHGSYQLRSNELEANIDFKQVIPYIVVTNEGKYLFARRSSGGSESRLRGKGLVGFGGHVRAEDVEGKSLTEWGKREIAEELDVRSSIERMEFRGVINRFQEEVDRVHVGLLILVSLGGRNVEILEKEKFSEPDWLSLKELGEVGHMEGWSRLVINSGLI